MTDTTALCATCQLWDGSDLHDKPGWGVCTLATDDPGYVGVDRSNALVRAAAVQGDDAGPYLLTSVTFGCVMHKPIAPR